MIRFSFAALTLIAALTAAAHAAEDRLLIVNATSGHGIYTDGRDDQYCVTRRHFIGYNDKSRRVFRRSMHCR